MFLHDGRAQPFRTASSEAAGHASLNAAQFGQACGKPHPYNETVTHGTIKNTMDLEDYKTVLYRQEDGS
ncbi:MAG: hypothetical protein ABSG32_15840 [Terriglobia bacterium]